MSRSLPACPKIEIAQPSLTRHTLVLLPKKADLKEAGIANLPSHLKDHSALKGDRGAKLVLHGNPATVIFGIGAADEFNAQEAAEWGEAAGHCMNREQIGEFQVKLPSSVTDKHVALNFIKGLMLANFRVDELKSKPATPASEVSKIFVAGKITAKIDKSDLTLLEGVVHGITFARTIIELPASSADPTGIVKRFESALDKRHLEVEIWDEKRIQKEKMGLLASVSAASATPPRFLIVRYGKDFKNKPTLCLVGKGVTFDTGGINLKTSSWKDLLGMKKDMGGAAAVLGTMLALAESRPALRVIGITPLTTNSIGSHATLPGDVVTSYAGKTVEIQNTDAEGRLILADALHYAVKQKPDYIVDVATLTGACVVALGEHLTGLFSNHTGFQQSMLQAASDSGEPAWPMPLGRRYGDELKSDVADMANMGKGRDGGAVLAAKFLEKFVENTPWCHLDIAGTVDLGDPAKAGAHVKAAGRMVHTFVTLAANLAQGK